MPKSKISPCASCESCSTRKTKRKTAAKTATTATTAKREKSAKSDESPQNAERAQIARLPQGTAPRRPKKSEVPPERLCEFCDAKCCRYFALPIDKPSTFEEFDYVRWYLLHEAASVFVEDGDWFLLVHTPCKELGADNRCKIYETRPQICREYSTARCEYDDLFVFEQYFETPEQVEEYAVATLGPRPGTAKPAPAAKPVKLIKLPKPPKKSGAATTEKKAPAAKKGEKTKGRASTGKATKRGLGAATKD